MRQLHQFQAIVTRALAVLLAASSLHSCDSSQTYSQPSDIALDPNANNIALVIGSNLNLEAVPYDVKQVAGLFNNNPKLGFKQVIPKELATRGEILAMTRKAAADVGPTGTLVWYYTGHGGSDGALFTQDRKSLPMRDVIAEIAAGREEAAAREQRAPTPLARLVVVLDSCFAGQNVTGSASIASLGGNLHSGPSAAQQSWDLWMDAAASQMKSVNDGPSALTKSTSLAKAFDQAILIGSSGPSESSIAYSNGSAFTQQWVKTMEESLAAANSTIADMVKKTTERTRQRTSSHTPTYRALPQSILQEPLVGPTATMPTGAFVALGPLNGGYANMMVSLPPNNYSQVRVCFGEVPVCDPTVVGQSFLGALNPMPSSNSSRSFFVTPTPVGLWTSRYTIVAQPTTGQSVATVISLRSR